MTSFIRVGIAAAAATALTFTAQAADMRPVYKAAPPVMAVYSWTGCYVGGQVGGQWARWTGDVNYPADPVNHGNAAAVVASREFQSDGNLIYGGQVGCNWQLPGSSFVLGVEGDAAGVDRSRVGGEIFRFPAPFATDHFDTTGKFGTQASLRVKGGFAIDRMLIYVAGGFTWANISGIHNFFRDGDGSLTFGSNTTRNGWNIGAGAEYALVNNWTMGVEYRYTDYGSFSTSVAAGTAGTLSWLAFTASANNVRTQDVRLRLNYMFNTGAVAARY